MQPSLDWSRDVNLPVSGRSVQARHASSTGAQVAAKRRGMVALAYRQLLIESGPLSDYEAASALGRLVSTINSTRDGWGDRVTESGEYESTAFGTKRTRWQWVGQVEEQRAHVDSQSYPQQQATASPERS